MLVVVQIKGHQTGSQETQSLGWTPPLPSPLILSISYSSWASVCLSVKLG